MPFGIEGVFRVDDIKRNTVMCGIFILIIIITLFLIICYHNKYNNINGMISGFYQCTPAFCSAAGIDSFLVYVGDKSAWRAGYILSTQGNHMLLNQPIEFKITWDWFNIKNWFIHLNHKTSVYGKWRFKEKIEGIPQVLDVLCYPTYGKIVLSDDNTIYATLYRNAETTEIISTKLVFNKDDMTSKSKSDIQTISEKPSEDVDTLDHKKV
jgi:hypothetical protein